MPLPPSADAYKAIYQDIPSDWRRRPGRPRQSWLATIQCDLRKLDIGLDNVPELAANHVLWRGLIRSLRTPLVRATDDDEYGSTIAVTISLCKAKVCSTQIKQHANQTLGPIDQEVDN